MKKMTMLKGLIAASAVALGSALAQAENFSYSVYLNPEEPLPKYGYIPWAKAVSERTNGDVNIEIYLSGSLLPARDGLTGARDGAADITMHPITYTPSELPIWNIIPDVGFKYPDPFVTAFASTEYGLLDAEGNGEFDRSGVVYLGGYSTPAYYFICRAEDSSGLEQLKGTRVRTPGGPWSRFVQSIGMIDVNIPSTEMYQAFERGALDCSAADPTHLKATSNLVDVAKSVNMQPMGPYFAGASWLFNKDSWSRISPENRKIIFEESAKAVAAAMVGYVQLGEDAFQAARDEGLNLQDASPDFVAALEKFSSEIDDHMISSGKAAGIDNIEQEVADISAIMEKWEGLLEGVDRSDAAKLGELLWTEVYSKLDPETYGLQQ